MEFFLVFVVSFFVLICVALAFALGRPPAYRPSRQEIFQLLVDVQNNDASREAWEMFLSLPIVHDAELELIRCKCLKLLHGFNGSEVVRVGVNGELLNKKGMQNLREMTVKLKYLLAKEPASKWF